MEISLCRVECPEWGSVPTEAAYLTGCCKRRGAGLWLKNCRCTTSRFNVELLADKMSTVVEQQQVGQTLILDPSDKFRPERNEEEFRNYTSDNAYHDRVRRTYYEMHSQQTVDFVQQQMEKWCKFDHAELTIMEAVNLMNQLLDESDPDNDMPNSVHAFQTAERIRQIHPDKEWFQLTGLIHDIGKVMAVWGAPQWSVVGDTYPVGCAVNDSIVFGIESFANNPDHVHPIYSQKYGMYSEHCGLDNVLISWGHDEYLYRVLLNHERCTLPQEALCMIRYHSFYPWHTSNEYMHLSDDSDIDMLRWVREFNTFDLYSKADAVPDIDALVPYYQSLIDKYIPGKVKW